MNLSDLQLTDDHLDDIIKRLKTLPHPFEQGAQMPATAETSHIFHNSATPIQNDAYMISQGCYGLSQDQPIGTEHVGNCIAIILRNPQSNLTSLIHFDDPTTPESLTKIIEAFKGQPFDVSIIGAKYALEKPAQIKDPDLQTYFHETSRTNLLTVLKLLAANDATLTSAWIADNAQPHEFLIDPKSGRMEVGTPSIPDPESPILCATRYFSDGQHDIALAYDLRESTERNPMPLNAETVRFFEEFGQARAANTSDGLQEWINSTPLLTARQKADPDNVPFFISMLNHYEQSKSTASVAPVNPVNSEQAPATALTLH